MLLSNHDRLLIGAGLAWAAMEHDKESKHYARLGNADLATTRGMLSEEFARLAEMFNPDLKKRLPR